MKIKSMPAGNDAYVYVVENPPPEFEKILIRAEREACGRNHKFEGGSYRGLTLKQAVLKDGKKAVLEIAGYLKDMTDQRLFTELMCALKTFIRYDKGEYTLEDVITMQHLFEMEIQEYQDTFSIDIRYEIHDLDDSEKEKIKNYILY